MTKNLYIGLTLLLTTIIVNSTDIELEAFVNLPSSRDVMISPDGKHISVVLRKDGEDLLAILETKTLKSKGLFKVDGKRKSVGKVHWINNKRIVYTVTQSYAWNKTQFENGELIGVNFDGKKHKVIFGYTTGGSNTGSRLSNKKAENGNHEIIDYLKDDDKNILIAFYPWKLDGNSWVSNPEALPVLYKLNVFTGNKKRLGNLPIPYADAIVDNNGKVRFASGVNTNGDNVVYYRDTAKDKWIKLSLESFEGNYISPLSFTKDNKNVYLSANVGEGTRALYLYNIKQQTTEKIFHDKKVDMTIFIRDFSGKRIIAVGTDLDLPKYHYLDTDDVKAQLHSKLIESFKGSDVVITSSTNDGKSAIVYVYSDTNPGDYYLFDTKKLTANLLLRKNKIIKPESMARTSKLKVTARDGMKIRGYITVPINSTNKDLPLVVLPHGGPHGVRDYWGYNWEVQLLASRGYAVLQVNFRGSGGFGSDFERAGFGNWGTSMQDDLTDVTKVLIKKGIVDSERICIYGASYGGYAALMGTIRDPNLYKCAIGSMGVYNLPMMFEEGDIPDSEQGLKYLKKVLGQKLDIQKSRSPVYNVDEIKADIMLIHGAKDKRAPIIQAESLMKAFDSIGKKYEWLKLKDEAHGYYDEKNRLIIFNKILAFLDKNIGKKSLGR